MSRLLLVEVGNSNTKIGIVQDGSLIRHWRVSTDLGRTPDEWSWMLRGFMGIMVGLPPEVQFDDVVISSVVPPIMPTLEQMAITFAPGKPMVIGPGIKSGLNIQVDNSRDVGADRIANAVAALHVHRPPLIVVDFGTAVTFSVLDATGSYIGGAIAPGVQISAKALFDSAAKLPRVELVRPKAAIGKSMISSMQAGILFGFAGLVDGMVQRMAEELSSAPTVIATGGGAHVLAPEARMVHHIDPLLTLKGLQLLWERNREKG